MANPHKFYLQHMAAKSGYRATWDPGKSLKIGYIGKLDGNGIFNVFGTLQKYGIPVEVDAGNKGDLDYTSSDSVSISIKAAGTAPVAGSVLTDTEAGFSISFKGEKSIVFQASGNKTHQLINLAEIQELVLEKYENGNWDKNWLIVTELIESDAATIIISNSSSANLDIKASAAVGAANLKLTDASLGLAVARETGSTLKYIAEGGLTPLYRLMGIRSPLFGKTELGVRTDKAVDADSLTTFSFDPAELD
jgi:hypothetical protein